MFEVERFTMFLTGKDVTHLFKKQVGGIGADGGLSDDARRSVNIKMAVL